MSNFAETMQSNPPRLVVQFQLSHDGSEQFQWGVVGAIPVLTLIGAIAEVQSNVLRDEWMPECDQVALVVVWDNATRELTYYLHPEIPEMPLVGMLETIKGMLVASRMAQHMASQGAILGPDCRPMRV